MSASDVLSEGLRAWRIGVLGRPIPPRVALLQRRILQRRLRRLSVVIAALVLAWIAVELSVLEGPVRWQLLGLRTTLAGLLLVLAHSQQVRPTVGLFGLIVLQAGFFAAMRGLLATQGPEWLQLGYGVFPYVLAAQLALLPLPALRSLLLAVPAVVLLLSPLWAGASFEELLFPLWLFGLILGLALWAAASQLGLLVELWSARWEAGHDALTGLANRREFRERLEQALAQGRRHGSWPSLLLLDIDHFKRVNDQYGHPCGDTVIQSLAALVETELREIDLAARWGGEEFIVLLDGTDQAAAQAVAERIRRRIETARVDCGEHVIAFTSSLGVAQAQAEEPVEALLQRLDQALYAAKSGGRNRVVLAERSVMPESA